MRSSPNSTQRWLARGGVCSLFLLGLAVLRGGGTLKLLLPRFTAPASFAHGKLVQAYGEFPLRFEANQGQADPEVKFLSHGNGYTLFLAGNEAVLTLKKSEARSQKSEPSTGAVLRMKWVGANTTAKAVGLDELPGKSNYLVGDDPKKWRTNVPTYAKVKYAAIYPGIDLVYYGNQRELEYDFVVAPAADPGLIRLNVGACESTMRGISC